MQPTDFHNLVFSVAKYCTEHESRDNVSTWDSWRIALASRKLQMRCYIDDKPDAWWEGLEAQVLEILEAHLQSMRVSQEHPAAIRLVRLQESLEYFLKRANLGEKYTKELLELVAASKQPKFEGSKK
jgi:hypothetical protein